jgi:hypothetical protein
LRPLWYILAAIVGLSGGLMTVYGLEQMAFGNMFNDMSSGALHLGLGLLLLVGMNLLFDRARAS